MSTMSDENYNGHTNRETWAFNLHWQNDQGLYNETLERVQDLHGWESASDFTIGEAVVDYWREQLDTYEETYGAPMPAELRMFEREVGSWWRINRTEVGGAVIESLDNES